MLRWMVAAMTAALLAATPVTAQEAVVGAPDRAALFHSTDPVIDARKQVVYNIYTKIFEENRYDLVDVYMTKRYIQHNPNIASGREAVKTLFRENPKRHVGQPTGATLTYMGDARFCLVECAARQGVRWRDASDGEVDGCVLHVTVFGVKYDKRGGLQTTDHHERSYLVSRYGPMFAAQTFWM